MSIDITTISEEDWAAVPADIRQLAATLAWRKHAAEAVVPLMAQIEPPSLPGPDFGPVSRFPLLED